MLIVVKETSFLIAVGIYKVFVKAILNLGVSYSSYITNNEYDFLFIRWKLGLVLVYIKVSLSNKGLKFPSFSFKYFRWINLSLVPVIIRNIIGRVRTR